MICTITVLNVKTHKLESQVLKDDNVHPNISYDKAEKLLEISGISKPINFNTESIGIIPKGAYEVVGQVIRSKTDDGRIDKDGMNVYAPGQRIFNIANNSREEVFDFISENSRSSYCACCGTSRERNKLFYIRRIDIPDSMYQIGSSCIKEHFDTSYFDLMKDISNGYHKIGISNTPEYRERTLQSEKPTIEMLACKKFPTRKIAEAIESALHTAYSQQRVRGEWFNLKEEDVAAIIETLK